MSVCDQPWVPISCPSATIALTSSGWRSTTQPRMKQEALQVEGGVRPAVIDKLVPVRDDRADQLGMALRHPAEDEERGPHAGLAQEPEQPLARAHHPVLEALPLRVEIGRASCRER